MIALLPWGAYEQHGPFLPADTDTTIAKYVAERIADTVKDSVVLDCIPYGISIEHRGFRNTISLDNASAICMLKSILESAANNNPDVTMFVIINGHGGNQDVASMVCRELNYTTMGARFEVFHVFQPKARTLAKQLFSEFSAHADSVETSVWASITGLMDDGMKSIEEYDCTPSLPHAMKLYPVNAISKGGIVTKLAGDLEVNKDKGKQVIDCSIRAITGNISVYMNTITQMKELFGK